MLSLLLAIKYLLRTKIVVLSILAVGLSCALLICISSLFAGFISALEDAASDNLGDVLIQAYPGSHILYSEELTEKLAALDEVVAASPVVSTQGLLLLGKGNVKKVTVWGIDSAAQSRVTNVKSSLIKQSKTDGEPFFTAAGDDKTISGYVGIGVLATPDPMTDIYDMAEVESYLGTKAVLMTGVMDEKSAAASAAGIRRVNVPFNICDVAFSGVDQFDSESIYLPIKELGERLYPSLSGSGIIADSIQIRLREGSDPQAALENIRACWRQFAWQKLGWSDSLISFAAVRLTSDITADMIVEYRKQMDILMLIFGLVSSGVIFLVCCIFYMIVLTRQKDIAIMRSCGAGRLGISAIFIQFGLVVGILGGLLGLWAGRLFTVNINIIENWISTVLGLNIWRSSVYMFNRIPNQVDWPAAVNIVLISIAAALIGSIIPALIAAAIKPVKILRYE